jgi:polar amino acid transport system substrate-binding protein
MSVRFLLTLVSSVLGALGPQPAHADCARSYSLGLSESGTFAYAEAGQIKGLIPSLVQELSRRTGCQFTVLNLPRARIWLEWEAGKLDIATGALRTPERDRLGRWLAFGYVQEELITPLPMPGHTLAGWLQQSGRPSLGRVRSAVSGDEADRLLASPEYAGQVELVVDHATVIRKLYAGRNGGALLPRPAFDKLARQLGLDPDGVPSYRVDELPRVAYGFYFRVPQVDPDDLQLLAAAMNQLLDTGFNEKAYADIVGKSVAARIFRPR